MLTFKKRLALIIIGSFLCLPLKLQAAEALNRTIVIVQGSPITLQEVQEQIALIKQSQLKTTTRLQEVALKSLIVEELMLQAAKMNGIDFHSKEINQMAEQALQSQEVPLELAQNKEKLKKRIVIESIRQSMMMSAHKTATEKEIQEQMNSLPVQAQPASLVSFRLETLIVPTQKVHSGFYSMLCKILNRCAFWRSQKTTAVKDGLNQSTQLAQQTAEKIAVKAKEGMSFKEIALSHRQKPALKIEEKARKHNELPIAYRDAVVNLKPGDVAGPFEFYNGFHFIRLKEVVGPKIVQARHILLKKNVNTNDEQAKQTLTALRQACLSNEKTFEQQVEAYSEDLATVFQGGDLGFILPDTLEKPFDEILENLKPGEISTPFETRDGWHIVKVINKQFFQPNHPVWKRFIAKRLVEEKKMIEAFEEIEKELYRSAYIEWIDPSFKLVN